MALKQVNQRSKRHEKEAFLEEKFLKNPQSLNPFATALRRDSYKKVLNSLGDVSFKKCVDLGSGTGELSKTLAKLGADVTAVDLSPSALKAIENIKTEQHFVPYTTLPDDGFDIVIANNLIAELPQNEIRLFFSELARIVKKDGKVLISTPIDIHSEDALDIFLSFAETELTIESVHLSYNRLFIRLLELFKFAPPLAAWLENQDFILKSLISPTQFLYAEEGVSYAVLIGKRRPLITIPENEQPIEKKTKKIIWE